MNGLSVSKHQTLSPEEISALLERLDEAEATLQAIRNGEVDALVVQGPKGEQVYTLRNAEEPYRLLVEQMREGALTLTPDGSVLYANRSVAVLLGVPLEKIVGGAFETWVVPADRAAWADVLAEGLGGKESAWRELHLVGGDGAAIPVQISVCRLQIDELDGACAILSDLTERNRREEAAAADRLSRAILSHATEAMVVCDTVGRITHASLAAHRLVGQDPVGHLIGEVFGSRFILHKTDVEHGLGHTAGTEALPNSMWAGQNIHGLEADLTAPDGSIRHFLISTGPHFVEPGQIIGYSITMTDITRQRRTEAMLAALNADLEARVAERTLQFIQAQKMEAIGQLTGGIAHDFNNLLQGIGSCLAVLEPLVPDGQQRTLFDAALSGIQHGARLTQALLAFARRQTLAPQPTDIGKLLEGMRPLLDRTLGGLIHIFVQVGPDVAAALVDPYQLESAIINLAINARDAMPTGGRIVLHADNVTVSNTITYHNEANLSPGSYVAIRLEDNGTGMDQATLARVFEPFFTTKDVGKGTGLGLSMVHGMAAQSGGGVAIDSAPGKGTTVSLYLPRAETIATQQSALLPVRQTKGNGEVVLLVDDDAIIRFATSEILESLGYAVVAAESGPAALRILEEGTVVDAMITDYAMPGMSGARLVSEARRLLPNLPVLMMSGYAEKPDDLDHIVLLQKPFQTGTLAEYLATLLALASTDAVSGTN
jgi:PAS domain S-box-containing protein